jgi:hypothetical protein
MNGETGPVVGDEYYWIVVFCYRDRVCVGGVFCRDHKGHVIDHSTHNAKGYVRGLLPASRWISKRMGYALGYI